MNLDDLHHRVDHGQYPFAECDADGLTPVHLVPLMDGALVVLCAQCSGRGDIRDVFWFTAAQAHANGWDVTVVSADQPPPAQLIVPWVM